MNRENLLRLMKDVIERYLAGNGSSDADMSMLLSSHGQLTVENSMQPNRSDYDLRPRPGRPYGYSNYSHEELRTDGGSTEIQQLSDFVTFVRNILAILPADDEFTRNRFERFVDHVREFFDQEPPDDDYEEADDPNDPDYVAGEDDDSDDTDDDSDAEPIVMEVEEIEQLPTREFHSSETQNPRNTELNGVRCQVCLVDFKAGDDLRRLPCFHEYHKICIDYWLLIKRVCPICQLDCLSSQ